MKFLVYQEKKNYKNLFKLNIKKDIKLYQYKKNKKAFRYFKKNFNEIYYLGGQSSVTKSFDLIDETYESQIFPIRIILDFIFLQKKKNQNFYLQQVVKCLVKKKRL